MIDVVDVVLMIIDNLSTVSVSRELGKIFASLHIDVDFIEFLPVKLATLGIIATT